MRFTAQILVYVLPVLAGIVLAWAGLSYSQTARTRFQVLRYPDGRKHILLIVIVVLLVLEGACAVYLNILKPKYTSRDCIIAKEYRMTLNVFLVKFRLILFCLPLHDPIEPRIEEAFHLGGDFLKTGVDLVQVDSDLIKQIFRTYDFSQPMVNYEPSDGGRQPTNAEWLHTELRTLNQKCREILTKYASAGDPGLIERVEMMRNRTDNLLNPIRPRDYSHPSDDLLHWLGDLFIQIKLSWDVIDEIFSETQEDVPSNKADAGDGK